jgi:hypothetical protein
VASLLLPYVSLLIAYIYFNGRAQEEAKLAPAPAPGIVPTVRGQVST